MEISCKLTFDVLPSNVMLSNIQLFRERLWEEMRTRQPRKVIWDMTNTLFVKTEAVEPTFVAFL